MIGAPICRRFFIIGAGAFLAPALPFAARTPADASDDLTFCFISDVHACRMNSGLSPNCQQEGKTDANLLRHVRALNSLPYKRWPEMLNAQPTGLSKAGQLIGTPRGVVLGGDMTDDGGGQTTSPSEGTQLLQFSHRYNQGTGPDRVHFPVYAGLGNHDLDQDGPPPETDWYRREMRDYVEVNHEAGVFFKPQVPAKNFDPQSDCYSWDWGGTHFVQLHRFGGDTRKGAVSALPWLTEDLAANAGKPIVVFQHYGWDAFSIERWDPQKSTFNDDGHGAAHWWSREERQALLDILSKAQVLAIFHGHEHETPMIYKEGALDLIKPKAAFLGGFAVAHINRDRLEVALGEATGEGGDVTFTNAFGKPISQ